MFNCENLINSLRKILANKDTSYYLHEPSLSKLDKEYVIDCLDSTMVSSVGEHVKKFENTLKKILNVKHVIAVNSGTAAIHLGLKVCGVKADTEVLIPSITFVATANAVTYLGATPHFIDCSLDSPNIDLIKLKKYLNSITEKTQKGLINKKTGKIISAIVPVHILGHPVDMDELKEISEQYNIPIVEDAAQSLGSLYKNKHCGTLGQLGCFSFNGNKIITTGGGGAIVTDNDELAEKVRHLSTTAKVNHPWEMIHDEIAYNYRMPCINAALGIGQLQKLDNLLEFKRKLANIYNKLLKNIFGIKFLLENNNSKSNYWLNAIVLDENIAFEKDNILSFLHENKIFARALWKPLHMLEMYSNNPKMELENAENIYARTITIPSSSFLINSTNSKGHINA